MQFTRLKLAGFKSFVENTDLAIEPGLSGVVGPNGCGKSNLIEALRWVMGETSARQMRGGEMDDVIFGGSTTRPSRNVAEVTLELSNDQKNAPAAFNEHDEIVIRRRIERSKGSDYRVNGKSVRAKDVHLLFADASTGARSPGIVSQGRIGAIVNAKPQERRQVLEDAAGITGLHSRRHEAELRLKAAETNLERLDDVVETMDKQLSGLKRQAQQAMRYRRLSEEIRSLEARLFLRRWEKATEESAKAAEALRMAERLVAELSREVAAASTHQADRANQMPQLRAAEADAAAALQRLTLAQRELESEAKRIQGARHHARQRLEQLAKDIEREGKLASEAQDAMARLDTEAAEIVKAQDGEAAALSAQKAKAEDARTAADAADSSYAEIDNRIAAAEATRKTLANQVQEAENRLRRLLTAADQAADVLAKTEAALPDPTDLEASRHALAEKTAAVEKAESQIAIFEQAFSTADKAEETARTANQTALSAYTGVKAEVDALTKLVGQPSEDPQTAPVLDQITVSQGFERALAAALGDDLDAPTGGEGGKRWQGAFSGADDPTLSVAETLAAQIKAPDTLSRRLAQVGLATSLAEALAAMPQLKVGQRLVTRDGDLIRWDGFVREAGAPTESAVRLEQRNRLEALKDDLATAKEDLDQAQANLQTAKAAKETAATSDRVSKQALRDATTARDQARQAADKLAREDETAQLRLDQAKEAARRTAQDRADAETTLSGLKAQLDALGSDEILHQERADKRSLRDQAWQTASAESRSLDDLNREIQARVSRLTRIAEEKQAWTSRVGGASERLTDLEARQHKEKEDLDRLDDRPAEIGEKQRRLATEIQRAEADRRTAADVLAKGETVLRDADRALKDTEVKLQSAREERVRAEAFVEQAGVNRQSLAERIQEKLDCRPGDILKVVDLPPEEPLGEEAALSSELDKLVRSREAIGPVNLRAEAEMTEVDTQIAGMRNEREDLIKAISRLRQGIAELNKEGRERLNLSFNKVDTHFRTLFVRLFGGGQARLEMVETDDPLNAGLDIMASPPGKKMQNLSLLSGGEQALTALALIFAVFLTNPAPICVLDEVDAPLDDSNVDRFCTLLEEIARTTGTRFMVITHHRMTMARMDRLYGVTMAERGVSTLVSVDLGAAVTLRDAAIPAAPAVAS